MAEIFDVELFTRLYQQGKPDREIAEYLGVSIATIIKHRKTLELTHNKNRCNISKLKQLHSEGYTDVEISKIIDVHHSTVTRNRQSLNLPRNKSKTCSLDARSIPELQVLHAKGYTDIEIAKKLGVSQPTITRCRNQLKLKPNRKKGEHGPNISGTEPYWLMCNRILRIPKLAKLVAAASYDYFNETGDWDTFFICRVREPADLFHPVPGPYATDPEKMYQRHADYIVTYEERMDNVPSAGVPGPAIIELARLYLSTDEATGKALARKAVAGAGVVSQYSTVEQVEHNPGELITPISIHFEQWAEIKQKGIEFFPEDTQPRRESCYIGGGDYRSSNGRKGVGGGTKNINDHAAWQGALGY